GAEACNRQSLFRPACSRRRIEWSFRGVCNHGSWFRSDRPSWANGAGCIASDQHIHQAWWNGSTWNSNDPTAGCGCTLPEFGTALTGYFWGGNAILDFIGTDQHVHQVWWTGSQYQNNDWTAGGGGLPFIASPLTGTFIST